MQTLGAYWQSCDLVGGVNSHALVLDLGRILRDQKPVDIDKLVRAHVIRIVR